MINPFKYYIFSLVLFMSFPTISLSQSYSVIDSDLGIYCADLPDGTNMLVNVTNNNGLFTINTLDYKTQVAEVLKLKKSLERRIKVLTEMKKDYDPSSDGAKLRQQYKYIANEIINDLDNDDSLDNLKPNKIYKKISALILQLKHRRDEVLYALETIERCVKNEDLIPPPNTFSSEVIYFPFRHPDYGTTEWMRGLGVTAVLHKKRSIGTVCVATSKTHSTINTFPKETIMYIRKNPCLMFWQTAFRNYPFCHYGADVNTGVGWFSVTSAAFSQRGVDDAEKNKLQAQLDNYSPIYVRAPTKKKPCRTK